MELCRRLALSNGGRLSKELFALAFSDAAVKHEDVRPVQVGFLTNDLREELISFELLPLCSPTSPNVLVDDPGVGLSGESRMPFGRKDFRRCINKPLANQTVTSTHC